MFDIISNKDLILKLSEEPEFSGYKFEEGEDTEFGTPHRLVMNLRYANSEISSKIGNSWFFSDCDGIRMITYRISKYKFGGDQFKLLDFSGDYDTIKSWILKAKGLKFDDELLSERYKLCEEVKKRGISSVVSRLPKIQYTINDLDRNFNALTFDVLTKTTNSIKTSLIFQICRNLDTNEIEKFYTIRELTNDSKPSLISLKPEIKFETLDEIIY